MAFLAASLAVTVTEPLAVGLLLRGTAIAPNVAAKFSSIRWHDVRYHVRHHGKPICAVPLLPELQRELPAGALLFGFDGELVFRSKNPNLNQEPRTYSLMPVADNESMYERRWNGGAVQDTFLSVEHFHGHTVRMFFLYFPMPKSTTSELSDKFLPLVKQAAKQAAQSSQITQELYSTAEKIIPGKEQKPAPSTAPQPLPR